MSRDSLLETGAITESYNENRSHIILDGKQTLNHLAKLAIGKFGDAMVNKGREIARVLHPV